MLETDKIFPKTKKSSRESSDCEINTFLKILTQFRNKLDIFIMEYLVHG